jgi:uracil phosphoribosyltransferase
MDPILGTGYSASRAVSLLVDAGVKEERILFVSLIAAPEGVRRLFGHHPQIKVVTSEIDDGLTDDTVAVLPGVGDFGDRYFGTE